MWHIFMFSFLLYYHSILLDINPQDHDQDMGYDGTLMFIHELNLSLVNVREIP